MNGIRYIRRLASVLAGLAGVLLASAASVPAALRDGSDTRPRWICRGSLYRDFPRRAGPGDRCPRGQHRRPARQADHADRHRGCPARSHGRGAPGRARATRRQPIATAA